MTISQMSEISKIVVAGLSLVGILVSLYMSRRSLKELHKDRYLRQKPYLLFEKGGYQRRIQFEKAGKRIAGKNPKCIEEMFSHLPEDGESIRFTQCFDEKGGLILTPIGNLRNYGSGPALNSIVTWIPSKVWIGKEEFEINQNKLKEPQYDLQLNTFPLLAQNICPNQETGLSPMHLPIFIEKDYEKKITRAEGVLLLTYNDIFEITHVTKQKFTLFTHYDPSEENYVHITFSDQVFSL